jgi:hypothetical protein
MRRLSKRLAALEETATARFPRPIDDETIIETLTQGGDSRLVQDVLEALFVAVQPALIASITTATDALVYCRSRGIERPPPAGPLDLLARINRSAWTSDFPTGTEDQWEQLRSRVSRFLEIDTGGRKEVSAEQARAFLVVRLAGNRDAERVARWSLRGQIPILTPDEGSRLSRLVEHIEDRPCSDLPLLLWKDESGRAQTSWKSEQSQSWTPVDTGLSSPEYMLLAPPSRQEKQTTGTQDAGDLTTLVRTFPSLESVRMSDEDLLSQLTATGHPFVRGLPDVIDTLFLHIEPYLRASVLGGAEALRMGRANGITQPSPETAIAQAAALVSYGSTIDMPEELVRLCGWALPDSESYDHSGSRLRSCQFTVGSVRGALIFRLLEKHGVHTLRTTEVSDRDLPLPSEQEVVRLLKLVEPLQWDPDPDLPLLVWGAQDGSVRSSRERQTGQIRSNADRTDGDASSLLLPDPNAGGVIPERTLYGADHYRPDGEAWRAKQGRSKVEANVTFDLG